MCRGATERALREEVDGIWVPVRKPPQNLFDGRLLQFAALMDERARPTTPISYQAMVDMYVGRKRTIYSQAMTSLMVSDVKPSDAYLKTFCKAEKIDFEKKVDPAPRIIQPRNPRYNMAVGVFLKPLEHTVYEVLNDILGAASIMKNLNAAEQASAIRLAWDSIPDPVAVDLDASRFDRHVHEFALKWEHSRYKHYFSGVHHDRLSKLLSWQIWNTCRAFLPDGFVKWVMCGRRASGDMNTALGNVVIMVAMIWTFLHHVGLTRYRLINNGDDSVLIISRCDLHYLTDLQDWFLDMGFLMKLGPVVSTFEKLQFCQTQPVWDGVRWIMCRDPRAVLAKDAHSITPLDNPAKFHAWLASVGDCGLSLAGNLPIFNEYYSCFVRSGRHHRNVSKDPTFETGMARLADRMTVKYAEPTTDARVSFWKAFDIDGTDQRRIERGFLAITMKYGTPTSVPSIHRPEHLVYRRSGARGPVLR